MTLTALPWAVTGAVHVFHAALVIVGAAVVVAMLWPAFSPSGQRAQLVALRRAAMTGDIVAMAEARARRSLASSRVSRLSRDLLALAAVATLISAGVHVIVCPEHFREAFRFGLFFLVASVWQIAWAIAVVRRASRGMLIQGAVLSAALILLWIVTRTVGLPFGLAEVEPVGGYDILASGAELTTVACCATLVLRGWSPAVRPQWLPGATLRGGA